MFTQCGKKLISNHLCLKIHNMCTSQFVPQCKPPIDEELAILYNFLSGRNRLLILTGAGLSTESGIPDYRSEIVGRYVRQEPMKYQTFIRHQESRKHFWARNYAAWSTYAKFKPNISHKILSAWEKEGLIYWLVTQNVDTLHAQAGSKRLIELHGSAKKVICLSCGHVTDRTEFQQILQSINPNWDHEAVDIRPDGDVYIPPQLTKAFNVPACPQCHGIVKPDVVFFGENVPTDCVASVGDKVSECDGMLVLGSSLQVHSAYRFVVAAAKQDKPIAIVNIGDTRADHLAAVKISSLCSTVLQKLDVLMDS